MLYKYYKGGGTKSIAYESAIMTATFFIIIHLLQVKVLVWGGGLTFGNSRIEKLLSISIFFIPIYFLLSQIFKRNIIVNIQEKYLVSYRNGYIYLIIYCIATFSLLTFLILKS